MAVLKSCILQVLSIDFRCLILSHSSFPGKQRDEEESLDNSLEELNHIKLDMRRLKNSAKTQKKQSPTPSSEVRSSLKQEILQLEKRFQDQFEIRRAVEKAFGYRTKSHEGTNETSVSIVSKPATELIKEIAVLELEVVCLEQYLLPLYRKAFDQKVSSISPAKGDERLKTSADTPSRRYELLKTPVATPSKRYLEFSGPDDASKVENSAVRTGYSENSRNEPVGIVGEKLLDSGVLRCHSSLSQHSLFPSWESPPPGRLKTPVDIPSGRFLEFSGPYDASKVENSAVQSGYCEKSWKETIDIVGEKLLDSGVHRCHSTLSQRSAFPSWASPPDETLADKAVRACHSQPLSMLEYAQNASNIISLAEHLGTQISDHVPDTPNKLSEDMIKCMSAIYCKLSDPPLIQNSCSSPNSSMSSSASVFSLPDQHEMWSPGFRNNSSFDVRLENPFHVEGLKEFSGPYSTMLEVPWIFRDSQKLADVENLLHNFRSLICRLEEVDPRKLRHEEKLAFWINTHNSLVMHAFLAYGIPQNNVKRLFLLLRAAYNIGGHTVSADTIQSSILGCRMSRPGQWLRLLISSRKKFKTGDRRQAYAIEHPEPLLHFALCLGNHSNPAVRAYTPNKVFQELETAKQEYIRATFGVRKDLKIVLPKIVESFAKDSSLCQVGIVEMVQQSLPESLRRSIRKRPVSKSRKSIEWIPHNFTFRYLISKELVR
ncbi:G2484-1 protein [Hibiscus syriacus]|uniref:G2484-1 protein n=1 Tax=Hibiscus syriacus TaxID=106335 RepID=A0A6A3AEF8_HIBSY|nr:G2484-1 protein [Hibiscus syriacus]